MHEEMSKIIGFWLIILVVVCLGPSVIKYNNKQNVEKQLTTNKEITVQVKNK